MDTLAPSDRDQEIMAHYGATAGPEIIRLQRELDLIKEPYSSNATFWRDRYFRLYDQLSHLADLAGVPRASNYEGGYVLDAVKNKLDVASWSITDWKVFLSQHPSAADYIAVANQLIYKDWLDKQPTGPQPIPSFIEQDEEEFLPR